MSMPSSFVISRAIAAAASSQELKGKSKAHTRRSQDYIHEK